MDWHLLESIFPLSILSTGGAGSLDGKPDSSPPRTWWIGWAGLGLYQGRENSEAFIYMITGPSSRLRRESTNDATT
jgi:hypothetical protein